MLHEVRVHQTTTRIKWTMQSCWFTLCELAVCFSPYCLQGLLLSHVFSRLQVSYFGRNLHHTVHRAFSRRVCSEHGSGHARNASTHQSAHQTSSARATQHVRSEASRPLLLCVLVTLSISNHVGKVQG